LGVGFVGATRAFGAKPTLKPCLRDEIGKSFVAADAGHAQSGQKFKLVSWWDILRHVINDRLDGAQIRVNRLQVVV
jgi:hypothetical protein